MGIFALPSLFLANSFEMVQANAFVPPLLLSLLGLRNAVGVFECLTE
jgi:hypothetical protein